MKTIKYILLIAVLYLGAPAMWAQTFSRSNPHALYTVSTSQLYSSATTKHSSPAMPQVPTYTVGVSSTALPAYTTSAWRGELNLIGAERPAVAATADGLVSTPPIHRAPPRDPNEPGVPLGDVPFALLVCFIAVYLLTRKRGRLFFGQLP